MGRTGEEREVCILEASAVATCSYLPYFKEMVARQAQACCVAY
jgi:hypothetical protein